MGNFLNSFYDNVLCLLLSVLANYHSYSGVIVKMLIDYKNLTTKQIVLYSLASIFLVNQTIYIGNLMGLQNYQIELLCWFLGFSGCTIVLWLSEDLMIAVLKEVKIRIIDFIKNAKLPKK